MKSRFVLALLLLVVSLPALSRGRAVQGASPADDASLPAIGATAAGVVSSVNGSLISLAGGQIVIDASAARIGGEAGNELSLADVRAGASIVALLRTSNVETDAPFSAAAIVVTRAADVTLTGNVQSVDSERRTFMMLGRTIGVDTSTSFGGFSRVTNGQPSIIDLQVGQLVVVNANSTNGKLIASSVHMLLPVPIPTEHVRGTVVSIDTDEWVVALSDRENETIVITAQTKILGAPKVGDTVEVIGNVDSSNRLVALSIIKSEQRATINFIRGVVISIVGDTWTIRDTRDWVVKIDSSTKILGNPNVGDRVDITARGESSSLVALTILKSSIIPAPPALVHFRGVIQTIAGKTWTFTGIENDGIRHVTVRELARIDPNLAIGDRVDVQAIEFAGELYAISITRLR